jgi:hypothetical protein
MEPVTDVALGAFDAVCLHCKRRIQQSEGQEDLDEDSESDADSSSTDAGKFDEEEHQDP